MTTGPFLRALVLGAALLAGPLHSLADVVMDWNDVAFKAVTTARQSPTMGVRSMAVVHTAMFDAMNAVQPRYRAFRFDGTAPAGASADVAASVAAHTALVKLFPEQRAGFDEALAAAIARAPEVPARNGGASVGKAVAESLLAWCAEDRVGAPTQYRPVTQPGVYVMTTLPVSDDFGASRPVAAQGRRPVPPGAAAGAQQRTLGARLQRDPHRRRPHGQHPRAGADAGGAVLGRSPARPPSTASSARPSRTSSWTRSPPPA
jgi:hypothetical protein